MSKRILDRREFLQPAASTAAVVAGGRGRHHHHRQQPRLGDDADDVRRRTRPRSLLQMTGSSTRTTALGDIYYADVVEALDAKAKATRSWSQQVKDGVAALDKALDVPFLELSTARRSRCSGHRDHAVLPGRSAATPWWRSTTTRSSGPSSATRAARRQDGGYLLRGFQDAGWTLQPDAEASPPPYLG